MADKPIAAVEEKDPKKGGETQSDPTDALQRSANPGPPASKLEATTPPNGKRDTAAEAAKPTELSKITDEKEFRARVDELIKDAKAGKPVSFDVHGDVNFKQPDGSMKGQTDVLYDQLKAAYPENSFTFAKPNIAPGDPAYDKSKVSTPVVEKDGERISSSENKITLAKPVALPDGSTLPVGSKFAVGTIWDGSSVRSADSTGKVWATTPDGKTVEVAGSGKSAPLPADSAVADEKGGGVGQPLTKEGRIIIRPGVGTFPDGSPVLDAYPNTKEQWAAAYNESDQPGKSIPRPKSADHFKLPSNITVEADLPPNGHSTASGADEAYYMRSGWGDQKNAAAKNYTGETDTRSAQELMRIRAEAGLTEPTQAEARLKADLAGEAAKPTELSKITDEKEFRARVDELIKDAKAGKPVSFDVHGDVNFKQPDGSMKGQTDVLYDQLKAAYPENSFTFAKPNIAPGDPAYDKSKVSTPVVEKDGERISSSENKITLAKPVALPDGSTLPVGSKFAVGTIWDGSSVRSADSTGKVWATTPDGKTVEVAGSGKSAPLPADSAVADEKGGGVGQPLTKEGRIIIRPGVGTFPDGSPVLDAYPNTKEQWAAAYNESDQPGKSIPRPKSADHFKLPSNITVEAELPPNGHSTASGADEAYYMRSGWGDQKNAAAKNYTGETDTRSAQELMRIRAEAGLTEPTQAEAKLKADLAGEAAKPTELSKITDEKFYGGVQTAAANFPSGEGQEKVWRPGDEAKEGQAGGDGDKVVKPAGFKEGRQTEAPPAPIDAMSAQILAALDSPADLAKIAAGAPEATRKALEALQQLTPEQQREAGLRLRRAVGNGIAITAAIYSLFELYQWSQSGKKVEPEQPNTFKQR